MIVDKSYSRRHLLKSVSLISIWASGCIMAPESGSHTSLDMDLRNVSVNNGQYTIRMNPRVGVTGELEPLRNVSILVKDQNNSVVCRRKIGDLERAGRHEPINITCSSFPHTITYDFEPGPCSDDISVSKSVYDSTQDLWVPEDVKCD